MSRARSKGTVGENFFLALLRNVFGPDVNRAPLRGTQDYGDFVGVPWLHESKNTQKPLVQQWCRTAKGKAGDKPWVILWKGDMRTLDGEPIAIMPTDLYFALVKLYKESIA